MAFMDKIEDMALEGAACERFPAECHAAQGAFRGVVGQADAPVI